MTADPDDITDGSTAAGCHHSHRVWDQQDEMRQQRLGKVAKVFAELTRHKPDTSQQQQPVDSLPQSMLYLISYW